PGERRRVRAQIRYNHGAVAATVAATEEGVRVEFDRPEVAVAPGQLCAFYDEADDVVLGAGWIERALA
ncbi:MAG: aminomethyltransferase beta-barrel domain-containing protein, partial [Planctomycetota bacterium]